MNNEARTTIKRMQQYIDRTKIEQAAKNYDMTAPEIVALHAMLKDSGDFFSTVSLCYLYGLSRGYRAAQATKKRGPAMLPSRIASARIAAGMTQEELSQKSGVPVAALADLESGNAKTYSTKQLLHIAGALDTTVDELVF